MVSAMNPEDAHQVLPTVDKDTYQQLQLTLLLVEFRDEVFVRVATDLTRTGVRVIRARSSNEARRLYWVYKPSLILINVDQPDESGWLLAAKLSLIDPLARVWLYQPRSSAGDIGMAKFLDVDSLLEYRGNVSRLSDAIIQLLDECRESTSVMRAA